MRLTRVNPTPTPGLLCLVLLAGVLLAPGPAHAAAQPPTHPIADVDIGAHIDRTTGIDFDARKNRLVTASDDRSIRIWDATNGRLLRTIWVPRDERKDGELYALAVDPKTSTAVVGGWTGYDWDGSMSIYVVDLNTGKFRGRIQGFEERIASLAYSTRREEARRGAAQRPLAGPVSPRLQGPGAKPPVQEHGVSRRLRSAGSAGYQLFRRLCPPVRREAPLESQARDPFWKTARRGPVLAGRQIDRGGFLRQQQGASRQERQSRNGLFAGHQCGGGHGAVRRGMVGSTARRCTPRGISSATAGTAS